MVVRSFFGYIEFCDRPLRSARGIASHRHRTDIRRVCGCHGPNQHAFVRCVGDVRAVDGCFERSFPTQIVAGRRSGVCWGFCVWLLLGL